MEVRLTRKAVAGEIRQPWLLVVVEGLKRERRQKWLIWKCGIRVEDFNYKGK